MSGIINSNNEKDREAIGFKLGSHSLTATSWKRDKTQEKSCHSGNILVFKMGTIKIFGGGDWRNADYDQPLFILDLAGVYEPVMVLKGFEDKDLGAINNPSLRIRWKDYGYPTLEIRHWKAIVQAIKRLNRNVLVSCQGGHGRTGTALAILASLTNSCGKEKDPVAFIRRVYCENAVESEAQIEYIEDITGKEVKEQPSAWLRGAKSKERSLFTSDLIWNEQLRVYVSRSDSVFRDTEGFI